MAYASRTLTATERIYSQLEKEALALVYSVQKFHQYLYGRQFVLVTDHKPLTTILGHKHGVPSLAVARLQRWALILTTYSYVIEFRPTKQHANADGLSKLPLGNRHEASIDCIAVDAFTIGQIQHFQLPLIKYRQQPDMTGSVSPYWIWKIHHICCFTSFV